MTVLLDANLLLRSIQTASAHHRTAVTALDTLEKQGDNLCIVPQSLYEFWVAATRPVANNGLGFTPLAALTAIRKFKAYYPMLPDIPAIYAEWESLVVARACHGKIAHDARYVAAMQSHGITHLLTFNVGDFARFPGIVVLDPGAVAGIP